MHFSVRQATRTDLPVLYRFEYELIQAERPLDVTLVSGNFHYYDLSQMLADENAAVFIAELYGTPVGSGSVKIRKGLAHNQFELYAHLGFMFTESVYRGKGINQLVVGECIKWARARGIEEIRLQVYTDNLPAISSYEKLGFKSILTDMRLT